MAESGAPLRLMLLTEGDPGQVSGGYLYQKRMAAAAGTQNAVMEFVSLRPEGLARQLLEAGGALRTLPPYDAILVDSLVAAPLAPWVRRYARRIPVLAIVHQQPGGVEHGPLHRLIRRRLDLATYRGATALIVTSEYLKRQLSASGLAVERMAVVPPGHDPADADHKAIPNLRHGRQAAVLCVSNWTPNKSIELALDAVAHLKEELATLHLVGRTDVIAGYTKKLRHRLAADDLRERVVVHGPLPPVALSPLLEAADIFVHPSRHEAYGAAVAEAMAAGLPVIAFRIDNLPYLVRDGTDGVLVPFSDVPAMAAAMALLIRDRDRRELMGAAARVRAMAWPTWVETAERFFAAIREAVTARPTPTA